MSEDAIIDEVRAIRDAIAREHNYDLDSIFRMLRQCQAESQESHVTFPPNRLTTPMADAAEHVAACISCDSTRR